MSSTNNNSTPMGSTQESLPHISKDEIRHAMKRTNFRYSTPIYRVPNDLRKLNESAYTPRLVSIGPLHRKNENLEPRMHDIKLSYVGSLLGETCKEVGTENVLDECLKKMKDLKGKAKQFYVQMKDLKGEAKQFYAQMKDSTDDAKQFYAEEVELDEHMLVIDGCFILEVLRRDYEKPHAEENKSSNPMTEEKSFHEPIFKFPKMRADVKNDLLLLENQLPFFVLQTLFDCTMGRRPNRPLLLHYVHSFFCKMLRIGSKCNDSNATNCGRPGDSVVSLVRNDWEKVHYHHILHFLYDHYLGHPPLQEEDLVKSKDRPSGRMGCLEMPSASCLADAGVEFEPCEMPSASDLAAAGVKFEPCEHLFKVEFERGDCLRRACFRIPTLHVDDSTEPILRNLIALEQCCPGFKLRFTSYAYLMDSLVNTEKDVEVLKRNGVVHNYLGTSNEASRFFNNLCKEVVLDRNDGFYYQILQDAVDHSKQCFSRFIPTTISHIESKFRATPWVAIAFSIGIISFVMSATNFIRSFLH